MPKTEKEKLFTQLDKKSRSYLKALVGTKKAPSRVKIILNNLQRDTTKAEKKYMTKEHTKALKNLIKQNKPLPQLMKKLHSLDKKHSTTPFLKRRIELIEMYTKKF